MAVRKSEKVEKRKTTTNAPTWQYLASAATLALGVMALAFGLQQTERFLIRDSRFILSPALEYGDESPNLKIDGVTYASRAQVLRVFQQDIGRSIYLFPLSERRNTLRRIPWVKDASIVRTWPNHIAVRITERSPVAFVQLRVESISRWSLIDPEGVILEAPPKSPFQLPVLTGVSPGESLEMRSKRVHRMMRLLDNLGPLRDRVSEIDVADLDDLKITTKMDGHALVLMLGDRNFQTRFQNLIDHYDAIAKRSSNLSVLDLRLDDRIITVLGGRSENE